MNLANKLTMLRVVMVPFLILFMSLDSLWARVGALAIFVAAAITDIYDGIIARRYKTITKLGIFLDPLADKLIISAALISFVGIRQLHIPALAVVLIITREYVITGLRTLAATRNVAIPANKGGKFKTTSQIVTIITTMVILIVNTALLQYRGIAPGDLLGGSGWTYVLGWALDRLPFILVLVTTVFTLTSGYNYMYQQRGLLKE